MHTASDPDNIPTPAPSLAQEKPDARSFAHFITYLEQGQFHTELSVAFQKLVHVLQSHASLHGGKPKGAVSVTLDLSTDESGVFDIRADFKTKEPKMPRPRSVMWSDAACNLVPNNPKQMDMFAVREVARNQPVKQL